jgi:hypothetical protein
MRRRSILAVLLLLGVAACAGPPRLRAQVEAFSTLAASPAPALVTIVAAPPADAGSLEFQAYAERLEGFLARRGFDVVPPEAEPAWRLGFGFGSDDGNTVVDSYTRPYDRWPGSNLRTSAGYRSGFGWPYETRLVTRIVYTRFVLLTLTDTASGEEAWRVRVRNVSTCPSFPAIIDGLLAAAFEAFPEAGTRTLDIVLENRC